MMPSASGGPGQFEAGQSLLDNAIRKLDAQPGECAVITATPAGIGAARATRLASIGYATTSERSHELTSAGASSTVPSLTDLTLRLRARPRPG